MRGTRKILINTLLAVIIFCGLIISPAKAVGGQTSHQILYSQLANSHGGLVKVDNRHPFSKLFSTGESFVEEEIYVQKEFNPLVEEESKFFLNASLENALNETNAYGNLTENLDFLISNLIYKAYVNSNKSSITVGIFFATMDLRVNGSTLLGNELVRLSYDRIFSYMERTTDTFVLLIGDDATARNLVRAISVSEKSKYVSSIKIAGLTHGYSGEKIHGFVTSVNSQVGIINGDDLRNLFDIEGVNLLTKVSEIFLPFCDLGKEFDKYGSSSVLGFFSNSAINSRIFYFQNAVAVDQMYLSILDSVLLEGEWNLKEEIYSRPLILVNEEGEELFAEQTIIVKEEIVFSNGTIPTNLTYVLDEQSTNSTFLGFVRGISRPGTGNARMARIQTRVTVKITPKPILPKPVSITKTRKTYVSVPSSKDTIRLSRPNSGIKILPVIGTPAPGRGSSSSGSSSSGSSGSSSSSSSSSRTPHKLKTFEPLVIGKLSISGKLPNSNSIKNKLDSGLVYVDNILNAIYSGYSSVKNKVYSWVDGLFKDWWNKWMRGVVKSILDSTVFKGTAWFVKQIKNNIKTWVSILYSFYSMQLSAYKLFAMMALWAIGKFASGILKYVGGAINDVLSTLSSIFHVNLTAVKKAINGWIDSSVKSIDSATIYLEKEISSTINFIVEEFKNSIFWKILSAMAEIGKAILSDILEIAIKDLLWLSVIAPKVLRGKFFKMANSLQDFKDATLDGIEDFANQRLNDNVKLDHARNLRKYVNRIENEQDLNSIVSAINNKAKDKRTGVIIIPWFDFLAEIDTEDAKDHVIKEFNTIIGPMAYRATNDVNNEGLSNLIDNKKGNQRMYILMVKDPNLLSSTIEKLKVDIITLRMHGGSNGGLNVNLQGYENLMKNLEEIKRTKNGKNYNGKEYAELLKALGSLKSEKRKLEAIVNDPETDKSIKDHYQAELNRVTSEINTKETEKSDYEIGLGEKNVQKVNDKIREFQSKNILDVERAATSIDKSETAFFNFEMCNSDILSEKVNKPTIGFKWKINSLKATIIGNKIINAILFGVHSRDNENFGERTKKIHENQKTAIFGRLKGLKSKLGDSIIQIVFKNKENNRWKKHEVKPSEVSSAKTTIVTTNGELDALSVEDLGRSIAAEKMTKTASNQMYESAKKKGDDDGLLKSIIKQYLLTVAAVIIAVNLAAWIIKTYAGLTDLSIYAIKEYGFLLIDETHKTEIKTKFLTTGMTIVASALFAILEDASDMAELLGQESLEIPLFMISKVGQYLLEFFEINLAISVKTYEETNWKEPVNLLKGIMGKILIGAALASGLTGVMSLILSQIIWQVLSAILLPL